jgi:hypothetical protein
MQPEICSGKKAQMNSETSVTGQGDGATVPFLGPKTGDSTPVPLSHTGPVPLSRHAGKSSGGGGF